MATRDEMNGLEAGAMLAALPLDEMIASLGVGIAKAQEKLDANALDTALKLAETKLELPGPLDANGSPTTLSRSLLSLGFTPTFYHFSEASLELKIEMKMSIEENKGLSASGQASVNKGPVAIAGSVSYSDARKYSADSSAMTHVSVRMVSSPPPSEFLEYIRKADGLPPIAASATTTTPDATTTPDTTTPASSTSSSSTSSSSTSSSSATTTPASTTEPGTTPSTPTTPDSGGTPAASTGGSTPAASTGGGTPAASTGGSGNPS